MKLNTPTPRIARVPMKRENAPFYEVVRVNLIGGPTLSPIIHGYLIVRKLRNFNPMGGRNRHLLLAGTGKSLVTFYWLNL